MLAEWQQRPDQSRQQRHLQVLSRQSPTNESLVQRCWGGHPKNHGFRTNGDRCHLCKVEFLAQENLERHALRQFPWEYDNENPGFYLNFSVNIGTPDEKLIDFEPQHHELDLNDMA